MVRIFFKVCDVFFMYMGDLWYIVVVCGISMLPLIVPVFARYSNIADLDNQ